MSGRRVYIRSSKANKHSYIGNNTHTTQGGSKETTSILLGDGEWFILYHYLTYNPGVFRPVWVVDYAIERGFARKGDRPRLLKRIPDICKRLVGRGILARIRHGFYRAIVRVEDLKAKLVSKVNSGSLIKIPKPKPNPDPKPSPNSKPSKGNPDPPNMGSKETDGTSPPMFSGCVSSVFLDNVRGFRFDGFVHGDRGRVLCFGDLYRFNSVSYAEVSIPSYTRFFDGLGVVILYFGGKVVECLSNPACHGRVESDWFEWRPPSGFYGSHSVLDARRVLRERVIPYALAIVLRVAVCSGVSLARLAQVVWAFHRELYYFIKRRSFTKTCLLYTSPSPRDGLLSRMPSSA